MSFTMPNYFRPRLWAIKDRFRPQCPRPRPSTWCNIEMVIYPIHPMLSFLSFRVQLSSGEPASNRSNDVISPIFLRIAKGESSNRQAFIHFSLIFKPILIFTIYCFCFTNLCSYRINRMLWLLNRHFTRFDFPAAFRSWEWETANWYILLLFE